MPLLSRNVRFGPPLKLTGWRKAAIGTWHSGGDPSVYGSIELDMSPMLAYLEKLKTQTELRLTLTHIVGKAVAETLSRHPQINSVLRWGRLYPRKSIDVLFQVASDHHGNDLSGAVIREADKKSVIEIADELHTRIKNIRHEGDHDFKKMKSTMRMLPGVLAYPMIKITGLIMYGFNLWSPIFGTPKTPLEASWSRTSARWDSTRPMFR